MRASTLWLDYWDRTQDRAHATTKANTHRVKSPGQGQFEPTLAGKFMGAPACGGLTPKFLPACLWCTILYVAQSDARNINTQ